MRAKQWPASALFWRVRAVLARPRCLSGGFAGLFQRFQGPR